MLSLCMYNILFFSWSCLQEVFIQNQDFYNLFVLFSLKGP